MIIVHIILILLLVFPAAYYFFFAVAALMYRSTRESSTEKSSFCIMIPAYKSDAFILDTVKAAMNQDYPMEKFRILVISDNMSLHTDELLRSEGAMVLRVQFANSTKAASLCAAAKYLGPQAVDYTVILDSDNIVSPTFLSDMNDMLRGRNTVVQGHRCAKNIDTPIAVADAIFEEVNNKIFRAGHCSVGLSSALIGSGTAIPYAWFYENVSRLATCGEDKEMELMLLKDGLFVEYAAHIDILDEKTRCIENLRRQRLRWMTSQYYLIGKALRELPDAKFKIGYADKLIQWTFPPRILLLTMLPLIAIIYAVAGSPLLSLFIGGTVILYTAILLGLPKWVTFKQIASITTQVPRMLCATLRNIFGKKGNKDTFIHTDHQQ